MDEVNFLTTETNMQIYANKTLKYINCTTEICRHICIIFFVIWDDVLMLISINSIALYLFPGLVNLYGLCSNFKCYFPEGMDYKRVKELTCRRSVDSKNKGSVTTALYLVNFKSIYHFVQEFHVILNQLFWSTIVILALLKLR